MFDKSWQEKIYKKKLQINLYPYDSVVSLVNKYFYKKKNKKNVSMSCIELGSGTGNNLNFLSNFGFNYLVGIEGSSEAIKLSKKIHDIKKCKYINADFSSLPFSKNYFDLCLDRGSINHNDYNSLKIIFSETNRVLKNRGLLISFFFSKNHSEYKNKNTKKNTFKAFKKETNTDGLITTFLNKREVIKIISNSNFELLELKEEITKDHINNKNISMWVIVASKK